MAVEVGPSEAGKVAGLIGTVVPQQEYGIPHDVFICVFDADVGVRGGDVLVGVILEALCSVICEDDKGGWGLRHVG